MRPPSRFVRSSTGSVLTPKPNNANRLLVDLYGDLSGILNMATKKERVKHPQDFDLKQIRMVVGMDFAIAADEQGKMVSLASTHLGHLQGKVVGPAVLDFFARQPQQI